MGKRSFIYKSKGGIGSELYRTAQKRVEYCWEIKEVGVKTAADSLDELTITWKGSLTTAAYLKRL